MQEKPGLYESTQIHRRKEIVKKWVKREAFTQKKKRERKSFNSFSCPQQAGKRPLSHLPSWTKRVLHKLSYVRRLPVSNRSQRTMAPVEHQHHSVSRVSFLLPKDIYIYIYIYKRRRIEQF